MARRDLSQPVTEVRYQVEPHEAGLRLDHWLGARVTWRSRTDLQRRIREGRILLDGELARKAARVAPGQVVTVLVDEGPAHEAVPVSSIPIDVLHEDRWLVALNKSPGVVVHPVGRHVMDTLINALHARYRRPEDPDSDVVPMIVHRLDRETSGVIVLAKDEAVRKALGAAFETRRVEKTYLALAWGEIVPDEGLVDAPIGPDPHSEIRIKVAVVPDGRPSRTRFEVVARRPPFTLVRCRPETGRQHQIRVHLAHLGHPIACDPLYGDGRPVRARDLDPGGGDAILLDRLALHAAALAFDHPVTGERLTLSAPLPEDMARIVSGPPAGGSPALASPPGQPAIPSA